MKKLFTLYNTVWYLQQRKFSQNFNSLQRHHNERDGVSNHQLYNCLLSHLFSHRSRKTSKLCATGLCEKNSPVNGELPTQRVSNVKNVSICWCCHVWTSRPSRNGSKQYHQQSVSHDGSINVIQLIKSTKHIRKHGNWISTTNIWLPFQ